MTEALHILDELTTGTGARYLSIIRAIQKDKVDVEQLRTRLQSLYKRTYKKEARAAIAEAIEAIRDLPGSVESSEISLVMDTLQTRLSVQSLGTTLRSKSGTIVRDVFRLGASDAKAGYKLTLTDHKAINIIADHDLLWIGDHFKDDLMPQFKTTVTDVMQTGLSRKKLAERLAEDLGGIVDKDIKGWEALADHTITKAREIGAISGFEEAGITEARVRAILDGKTSKICRRMNGRIIPIGHLKNQRDNILAAKTTTDLMNAQAWHRDFNGTTADLPENLGIPTYHYRCRTKLFPIIRKKKVTANYGVNTSKDDQARLDKFTPEEHMYRAKDIQVRAKHKGLPWRDKDLKDDVTKALVKHGLNAFGDDSGTYIKRSWDTVAKADDVQVQIFHPRQKGSLPRMQYRFYSQKTGAVTVVDDDGTIRGCYKLHNYQSETARQGGSRLWLK